MCITYHTVSILYYYNIYALYIIQCPYNIYIHGTVLSSNTGTLPTMGSLRLVGSLHSSVSFAEYRLFYRALLQKRQVILKSLLVVATPQYSARIQAPCRLLRYIYALYTSRCLYIGTMYHSMGWLHVVGPLKL